MSPRRSGLECAAASPGESIFAFVEIAFSRELIVHETACQRAALLAIFVERAEIDGRSVQRAFQFHAAAGSRAEHLACRLGVYTRLVPAMHVEARQRTVA